MSELGTSFGVFVVLWFDAPNLPQKYKPKWQTLEHARAELKELKTKIDGETDNAIQIAMVVVDASLDPRSCSQRSDTK
jgi:hypothetical protein